MATVLNDADPPPPTDNTAPNTSTAQVAALLHQAYRDIEALNVELDKARKRADRAEQLASSLQSLQAAYAAQPASSDSPKNTPAPQQGSTPAAAAAAASPPATYADAVRIVMSYEDRVARAEQARDDADARRRVLQDNWQLLEQYLRALDAHSADAKAAFAKIAHEGAGQLSLGQLPSPPTVNGALHRRSHHRPLSAAPTAVLAPPPPHSVHAPAARRPRTPSIDAHSVQPPPKRPRPDAFAESYPDYSHRSQLVTPHLQPTQPRVIAPPQQASHFLDPYRHHAHPHSHHSRSRHPTSRSRSRSRSSSRSSARSLSVDEMLLQATAADDRASTINGSDNIHSSAATPRAHQDRSPRHHRRGRQLEHDPRPHVPHEHHQIYVHPPQGMPARHPDSPSYPPHHHPTSHVPPAPTQSHVSQPPATLPLSQTPIPAQDQPPISYRGSKLITNGAEPHNQPGQIREYQTHIFAPPVTGAPTKKTKFTGSQASLNNTNPAAPNQPVSSYPPTNEQGQRICRQCGMAGRYKDGKCVEKWGPGPMGPGTVCDRCRKKMKRVERRGTMENQHLAGTQSMPSIATQPHQQQQPPRQTQSHIDRTIQRSDTLPAPQSQLSFSSSSFGHNPTQPQSQSHLRPGTQLSASDSPSPYVKPAVKTPPSPHHPGPLGEDNKLPTSSSGGRGGETVPALASRSYPHQHQTQRAASRAGSDAGTGGRASPKVKKSPAGLDALSVRSLDGNNSRQASRSPFAAAHLADVDDGVTTGDADGEDVDMDMDLDAEAEAEVEAEIEEAVEAGGSRERSVDKVRRAAAVATTTVRDGDGDADPEQELLEAVDAAEANSVGSSRHHDD